MNQPISFDDLVRQAAGVSEPYAYQRRLAEDGLPDVLRVPTGAGKTMAAVLPWLYRRRFHSDLDVRKQTPHWLVFVLPQRALVEQTVRSIDGWLSHVAPELPRYTLMGGADLQDREWKTHPARDAIFVGTQDVVLSRLLMRGYAEPRTQWPMSFGLLHAGVQFVFDEVQLMGPGLSTSLQLHGLRQLLGTAQPCSSMWMSATLEPDRFAGITPDTPGPFQVLELGEQDRQGSLHRRLEATRLLKHIKVDAQRYERDLAELVLREHSADTRTLVVLNTVDRAVAVYDALAKSNPAAKLVLLHSRYRPPERTAQTEAAIGPIGENGTIVVSTQVLEAGMDVTSQLLVTELAPWSSIVQRAGRCNRDGSASNARILWATPPPGRSQAAPYEAAELEHSAAVLAELEGHEVTSMQLQEAARDLDEAVHPVLRWRDLIDLFDTAPDLSGNDIDVTQWIRDADDRTTFVAWRDLPLDEKAPFPGRDELCPAPLTAVREIVKSRPAWVYDQGEGRWQRAKAADVRPSAVVVFGADSGGYLPDRGFAPKSSQAVAPLLPEQSQPAEALETDPLVHVGSWVSLTEHLADVDRETVKLLADIDPPGVPPEQRTATALAGRYHDLGKAHPTFDTSLRKAAGDPCGEGPWAKSPGKGVLRHDPKHFRHELVSALLLLDPETGLLDGVTEPDLVVFLVLAHHGKVRLSVRARPDEPIDRVLGVTEGDSTNEAVLPDGRHLGARQLTLKATRMNEHSFTARTLRLRDRADLGPFRLAFLESVVRVADWIASASYDRGAA